MSGNSQPNELPPAELAGSNRISLGSATSNQITGETTAAAAIADIQSGKWAREIEGVRAAEGEEADRLKKNLPGILWAGTFSTRKNDGITKFSCYLCADIDKVPDRVQDLRETARQDQHAAAAFVSPSGKGVKIVFRVPEADGPNQHQRNFDAIRAHVAGHYGATVDEAGKDVARLCFVSHDPEAFFNAKAVPLDVSVELVSDIQPANVAGYLTNNLPLPRARVAERILGPIQWTDETTGFCRCPGENRHTAGNGPKDCKVMVAGVPTIHCLHNSCTGIVAGVNHELRSQIGKAEKTLPVESGPSSRRPGVMAEYLGGKSQESASPAIIVLPSGSVKISESARTIFQRIAPRESLFWRGGVLVELFDVAGVKGLEVLRPEKFRSDVEKIGDLFAWRCAGNGEPSLKPSKMSLDDAKAILAASESREFLPPVASVLRCPLLTESKTGAISILGKGYHQELGGLLIVDGEPPPAVPLTEAVEGLRWLIEEFDFQTESDFSRALAAFLTPGLRLGGFIRGNIPIDCAEANASQSGKGYRHEMVWTLYNEKAYLVTDKSGGVGSVDESFAAALVSARPFICLDNFRGRMDSRKLESFLTCPTLFPARIPGRQEALIDPKKFMLQISSNGLESTIDLANRASICRIRKRPGFQYRDTMGELQRRQPFFLGCVFAVISHWIAAGKPRSQDTRHDFREWAQTLDWIIQHICNCAPLLDGHQAAQERTSNPALSFIRAVALAVAAESRLDIPLIASELVEVCEVHAIEIPGKPADDDRAKRQVGALCKQIFRESDTVNVDGFTIIRSDKGYRKPSGDLDTTKAYTFTK